MPTSSHTSNVRTPKRNRQRCFCKTCTEQQKVTPSSDPARPCQTSSSTDTWIRKGGNGGIKLTWTSSKQSFSFLRHYDLFLRNTLVQKHLKCVWASRNWLVKQLWPKSKLLLQASWCNLLSCCISEANPNTSDWCPLLCQLCIHSLFLQPNILQDNEITGGRLRRSNVVTFPPNLQAANRNVTSSRLVELCSPDWVRKELNSKQLQEEAQTKQKASLLLLLQDPRPVQTLNIHLFLTKERCSH